MISIITRFVHCAPSSSKATLEEARENTKSNTFFCNSPQQQWKIKNEKKIVEIIIEFQLIELSHWKVAEIFKNSIKLVDSLKRQKPTGHISTEWKNKIFEMKMETRARFGNRNYRR